MFVASSDGQIRDVQPHNRAPVAAALRVEGDVAAQVARVDDLADRVEALDVSEATDTNERAREPPTTTAD